MKRHLPKPARPRAPKPIFKINKKERAQFERQHQDHVAKQATAAISKVLELQRKMEPALQELRVFAEMLGQPLFKEK